MAKTASAPATPATPAVESTTLISSNTFGRESKNYRVLADLVPKADGRVPVLISNDGSVYLSKAVTVPPGAQVVLTLTIVPGA